MLVRLIQPPPLPAGYAFPLPLLGFATDIFSQEVKSVQVTGSFVGAGLKPAPRSDINMLSGLFVSFQSELGISWGSGALLGGEAKPSGPSPDVVRRWEKAGGTPGR